ncbi:winged helix-turn-helix domain-containing protein [Bradyrhizobium sp. CIAT3101]|uniref:tetratricopeptide repeat protein n=1 Tax=Bradyrhizobium sp. CIAT3101 TaxID=439387 RepID=UPI0024B12770|nr:winged helix-turn-helix domain-containing protein [Bradyrhizobium sp. CIAT3101]WFU79841.1 winged helix-turn-helix domain-containing protein [Bradyrhizobium sp. CIAT3101]
MLLEPELIERPAAASAQPGRRTKFGAFEADPRSGELVKNGRRVRLQEQPFQLLSALLERPGEVVTREELRTLLWPQTVVDYDHGLNKAVSKIREALGDSAESPRFVETVARRGYRFLADVTVVVDGSAPREPDPPAAVLAPETAPPARPVIGRRHGLFASIGLALLLAAALLAWLSPRPQGTQAIHSLAVLPLVDTSEDPSQDFFADGMTGELITELGKVDALRVISRTSAMTYKGAHKSLATIARELHVDALIEGSVMRANGRVRITAQLIQAADDSRVWADSYEGDVRDALTLQVRVARAVAGQVRATLNHGEHAAFDKPRSIDPLAYENYLKGRYFLNKRTGDGLRAAIRYFRQAIEVDRNYAEAHSGLADAYALAGDWEYGVLSTTEAFSKATAAASKALELDGTLGEAHTSLAFALDLYGWDWDVAASEYEAAIRLNPSYATAHHWYAWHLMLTGKTSEALREFKEAQSLDPLSLIIGADIADAFCINHDFDAAVAQSRKTLELDPGFAVGHYELGQALVLTGSFDEAIAEFRKAIEISGHSSVFDSNLAYAYAVSGRKDDAARVAADMAAHADAYPSAQANIALIYLGLGDRDAALGWLEKAYEARFNPSILLRPAFDPLRSDARFTELMRRIGLGKT